MFLEARDPFESMAPQTDTIMARPIGSVTVKRKPGPTEPDSPQTSHCLHNSQAAPRQRNVPFETHLKVI